MRKITTTLLLLFIAMTAMQTEAKTFKGKDGYKIKVKFTDLTDSTIYLVHYYGKPLPTIYRSDSAILNKKGEAVFETDTFTVGGIYMVLLSDKSSYFEMLLNNGDEFSVTATKSKLPSGITFKNSEENTRFVKYVDYLTDYGKRSVALNEEFEKAKTAADTEAVRNQYKKLSNELKQYRRDYSKNYPNTLLTNIFKALNVPEVPEGKHLLPDGTEDSSFAYDYYKGHYWDDFDFQDDRLIHTPIYDGRLEEYFGKLVLPLADTFEKEADAIIAKTRGTKDMFKYTLWWLTRYAESSKIMGMDAAFVYLVENYYMRGDAFWLSTEDLEKYIERAQKIAPNVLGKIAPELKMPDINGKIHSLHDLDAKYTLLIFWSPECGHCLTEMPKVDSLYKAVLKKKGVKIYGVRTEGDTTKWKEVIKEKGFDDWVHVYDPERKTRFRAEYDIYSTPVLYLLDERKIIRGKRIDHSNILDVIEMLERKEKDKKAGKLKS
ncbi:MAG: DUF5106 domain-containing protein [Chitinophagales bacterium]|nr:DUF5106 domain-containing protein [Chitinophagales bacterium]